MVKKIGIVFNGSKSQKKLDKYIDALKQKKHAIEVFTTENAEDISKKTRMAVEAECDCIVSAGGDGTLLYVINALASCREIPLGILPLGTANDFSKMLGIHDIEDAVQATQKENIHPVDMLETHFCDLQGNPQKLYFCSTAGIGLFANLFRQEKSSSIHILRKVFGNLMNYVCTAISIFTTPHCTVHIKELQHCFRLKFLEISKVRECGGLIFTPRANIDDTIFDMWIASDASIWHLLHLMVVATLQKHLQASYIDYFCDQETYNRLGVSHLKEITLEISEKFPFHLHGEFLGHNPEYIKIAPDKLNFLSNIDRLT